MDTKVCPGCDRELNITEFARHPTRGTQRYCRECQSRISRDWYQANKERQLLNNHRNTQRYVNAFNEWKQTLSCQLCSESVAPCLDFHHMNGNDKEFVIGSSVRTNGLNATINELKKCICVCANCHRKIHSGLVDISPSIDRVRGEDIRSFVK